MKPSDTHKPRTVIVYPRGRARVLHSLPRGGPLSVAMIPGAILYRIVSGVVRSARLEHRGTSGGSVVISVGNIEVGGNGKTPMAIDLINRLFDAGQHPVYISRGFKSEAERLNAVTVVAPERSGSPLAVPAGVRVLGMDAGRPITPRIGDEGAVVMMRCPAAPLLFSRDRRRAIDAARQMFEPTHIVLDDAFQTWTVARDIDIVLLDSARPLGNGRLLPAGTLREGVEALKRAHTVGFNDFAGTVEDLSELCRWVSEHAGWSVPVFGIRRTLNFINTGSRTAERTVDGPAAAMSSIARPGRFENALRDHDVDLRLSIRFPDHHGYDATDTANVESLLAKKSIDQLIVTEKDWVKLRETGPPSVTVWVTRLELDIVGEDPFLICEKPQAVPPAFL
jgi:tetraacyldisaccharide 4'-kinase